VTPCFVWLQIIFTLSESDDFASAYIYKACVPLLSTMAIPLNSADLAQSIHFVSTQWTTREDIYTTCDNFRLVLDHYADGSVAVFDGLMGVLDLHGKTPGVFNNVVEVLIELLLDTTSTMCLLLPPHRQRLVDELAAGLREHAGHTKLATNIMFLLGCMAEQHVDVCVAALSAGVLPTVLDILDAHSDLTSADLIKSGCDFVVQLTMRPRFHAELCGGGTVPPNRAVACLCKFLRLCAEYFMRLARKCTLPTDVHGKIVEIHLACCFGLVALTKPVSRDRAQNDNRSLWDVRRVQELIADNGAIQALVQTLLCNMMQVTPVVFALLCLDSVSRQNDAVVETMRASTYDFEGFVVAVMQDSIDQTHSARRLVPRPIILHGLCLLENTLSTAPAHEIFRVWQLLHDLRDPRRVGDQIARKCSEIAAKLNGSASLQSTSAWAQSELMRSGVPSM